MMHIDPDAYYYIPEIFNTLRDVYRVEFIRSRKQLTWTQYIASLDMGIEHDGRSYHPQNAMASEYYRIVNTRKFLLHAIRFGVRIDASTLRHVGNIRVQIALAQETYAH